MKAKEDRSGNYIGDGTWNIEPSVFDFSEYPQVTSSISYSNTTESAYVTYRNTDNLKSITVRFSEHENNAVKFGDQLNGLFASRNEIMYRLGIICRKFIPNTYLHISTMQVKKKEICNYEIANITIKEMYDKGANADISEYIGKIAKDSNYLIIGDKVEELQEFKTNLIGSKILIGKYIYE